jgi:hypothetical protein
MGIKSSRKTESPELQAVIDRENWLNELFKRPLIAVPTNMREALPVFESIAGQLSPENLHCDGEISNEEARAKEVKLNAAWAALETIVGRKVSEREVW